MLAVAEIGTELVGAVREADQRQHRARGLAQCWVGACVAPELERMPGMRLHGERNVVERGEIEKQRGDLEGAGKAERAAAMDRQRRDIAAGEVDASGIGYDLARELPDQ